MKRILSLISAVMLFSITAFANDSGIAESYNAQELQGYSIMLGDPDGNMRLSDNLTRAEAVTLIVRAYGFVPETSAGAHANEFSDMQSHWACNAAMIAKGLRITDGEKGEAFCPDESIESEEFVKMIVCLLGYREVAEQRGQNPIGYLIQASQLGVTNGVNLSTGQVISRGQAAKLLCNSLDVPLMEMTTYSAEGANQYTIMNGKNGIEFRSLRTMLENK